MRTTFLATLLAVLTVPVSLFAQGSGCAFLRGDANGSGTYQPVHDWNYIMSYLYSGGPAPSPMDAADANDDGVIGLADATYLSNYDNSTGPAPPAPFPSAGYDPTPDTNEEECDAILSIHSLALTSYLPTSASAGQDIRPLVTQRGVGIDGSPHSRGGPPFHLAGNAMEGQHIGHEVIHEATGTFEIFDVDLALPASGAPWVIGRSYNARQQTSGGSARDSNGYQGSNWFQTSQPEIVHYDGATDSKDIVYLIYGADRFVEFKRLDHTTTNTTFRATNGAAGVVVFTVGGASIPDTYCYTDQNGYQHYFFGFDGDAGTAAGQFWKTVYPDGQVAFVGHATTPATAISSGYSSGRIYKAYDTADRRYTYTPTSLNGTYRLTEVVAETKTSGTWDSPSGVTEVASVEYSYYGDDTYGDIGDLKVVTITLPLTDSGVSSVTKRYYRYYEGSYHADTNPGYPHGLKLIVGPEGTRKNTSFLTESTDDLKPYAEAHFAYDTSQRIKSCWMNGSCGCSGGLNGSYDFTYATNGTDDSGYDEDEWRYRTVVARPDGGYATLYFDEVGQALARVVTDADPSGSPTKTWATVLDRDSGGVVAFYHTPANITAYTHSTGEFTKSTSVGLVRQFVRETTPNSMGYLLDRKWKVGTSGTAYLDGSLTYDAPYLAVGASRVVRPFVASVREYTEAITSGTSGSDLTQIATTLHVVSMIELLVPEFVTTTLPDVSTGNNGEGTTTTTTKRYFTLLGENTYDRSMDGIITYREFTKGQLTKQVQDADTASPSPPSGFSSSGTELNLSTTHVYDAQGRRTTSVLPSGESKETYYTNLADGRLVELAYNDHVSSTFYGPVQLSVFNHNRRAEVVATIGFPGDPPTEPANQTDVAQASHIDETKSDPLEAINGEFSVSLMVTTLYDNSGFRRDATRTYFDTPSTLPGTDGTHYDATTYGYDDSGRVRRTKEAHGTITRTVRDLMGNATETWLGTNDNSFSGGEPTGTDDMVKTMASEYDSGSGGGNQYLTKTTAYVEGSTTGQRVSTYTNDARGRQLLAVMPVSPHVFNKFDNLGRLVARGLYSSTASINVVTEEPVGETDYRLGLSQSMYDERGRVWKTLSHKIASNGTSTDTLEALTWYDREGRICKVDGTELSKTYFDRLGRQTHYFVLAVDIDSTYANVLDVSGDTVLVESQSVRDPSNTRLLMEARIDRHHDYGGTGALDSNGDGDPLAYTAANISGRIQIAAHWYDQFGRIKDTVQYGNYNGSDFDRDGLSAPTRSATALRSTYTYSVFGQLQLTEDPRAIKRFTGYDDAGRRTSEVANASDNPPGAPSGSDVNQTVLYGYTDGLLTTMTADMPSGTADQVTTYTYNAPKGSGAGDSKIASGHLLWKVTYPETDVVAHAYNAQGEAIYNIDQGGNVIDTAYDTGGRVQTRTVTTVGSGFDSTVRQVGFTYTDLGQPNLVTQYSNTGGSTIIDQVDFGWDGWGLIASFEQDHNSAVGGGGDDYDVTFSHAKATAGRNTLRRTNMIFESEKSVDFGYASGTGDNASRVTSVNVTWDHVTTEVATYAYNGFTQLVGTDYTALTNDVYSRYYSGGAYGALDRFNRVVQVGWYRDLATDLQFVNLSYVYDENSNVTRLVDDTHKMGGGTTHGFDVLYTVDNLDRLTNTEEGNWTGSIIDDDTRRQNWTLSHTGNWATEQLDLNGDGDYLDAGEYNESRSHNKANELTSYKGYTPTYDGNGNLTDDKVAYKYEFDAFNRLKKVKNQSNVLLAEYKYNGLGFLIAVHNDTDEDGTCESNSDDPWYHYVYDDRWRKIATYRDGDTTYPKEEFIHHEAGAGEASHLNDNLIRRDKDASTGWSSAANEIDEWLYYCHNWRGDIVAIVDSDGKIVEWVHYSAYGVSFGITGGDTDGDMDCDADDLTQIDEWIGKEYNLLGDLDLDGDVDSTDYDLAANAPYADKTLGKDKLSTRRNVTGYASYLGDQGLSHLRHVRHRVLDVSLGRWLQRDPLGYVDGMGVYSYAATQPIKNVDALGLFGSSGLSFQMASFQTTDVTIASHVQGNLDDCNASYRQCLEDALNAMISGASPIGPRNTSPLECMRRFNDCLRGRIGWSDLLDSSPDCDEYNGEQYWGVDLECFCRCAGNSAWSQDVRGCLRALAEGGVGTGAAHAACYRAADGAGHDRPVLRLAWCFARCLL